MTRKEILKHQVDKTFSDSEVKGISETDMLFVLDKATNIVDGYVHYKSGKELDYVICDIALDMLLTDRVNKLARPIGVPSNVASLQEGDTTINFNNEESTASSGTSVSSRTGYDAYYIQTYADELNRYRKMTW